jgi:site-specific recombinase XerD
MNGKSMVDQYLGLQSIATKSRYTYAGILQDFERCALERGLAAETVTTDSLRAWLQEEIQRSPLRSLASRICVIARYLEWRRSVGKGSHLLLELRAQYGGRLRNIVRALLKDDYEAALQRLRPAPTWGSALGATMREHIARMQSLGLRYEARAGDLRTFDRFLQRHPELASAPLPRQLTAWSADRGGVRHQLRVQQCGRLLSKAMHRKDVTAPMLSIEPRLHSRAVQEERRPHLFTEAEVRSLLAAARAFPSKRTPLRPIALHAIITLAYCSGLRIGEIASLKLGDLETEAGLLDIRETKFFKTRRLPLAASALSILHEYLQARAASGAPTTPDAPMWWNSMYRCGYSRRTIKALLTGVMRQVGLKPPQGRKGPRVHDLRHTFVAHRMMQWYCEGIDPQTRLPHLATYLGHKDIASTLVYLHITPELLQRASERHRRCNAGVLRASEEQP